MFAERMDKLAFSFSIAFGPYFTFGTVSRRVLFVVSLAVVITNILI